MTNEWLSLILFKNLIEESSQINKIRDKFYTIYPEDMIFELDREREVIIKPFLGLLDLHVVESLCHRIKTYEHKKFKTRSE